MVFNVCMYIYCCLSIHPSFRPPVRPSFHPPASQAHPHPSAQRQQGTRSAGSGLFAAFQALRKRGSAEAISRVNARDLRITQLLGGIIAL